MGNEVAGDLARAAAAAPMDRKQEKGKQAEPVNPLLAVLGAPSFVDGDGREYPRTVGFGSNKKPHPDGGTNCTAAWVIFKPFKGLDTTMEARIYRETYPGSDGKTQRSFSVSIPFVKVDRKDGRGREAVEALKLHVRDSYRAWRKEHAPTAATKAKVSSTGWIETDEAAE